MVKVTARAAARTDRLDWIQRSAYGPTYTTSSKKGQLSTILDKYLVGCLNNRPNTIIIPTYLPTEGRRTGRPLHSIAFNKRILLL